jgi:hypothetical protein
LRIQAEMINPIAVKLAFRLATAFAILASTVSPTRLSGIASISGRNSFLSRSFAAPSNHSARLSATWTAASPERIKALPGEKGEELGRTIHQARCGVDSPSSSYPQTVGYRSHTNPFRTNNPLRC